MALNLMAGHIGLWLHVILFAVIFCETGLVILPFLPGDSLLFALGALGAIPETPINLPLVATLLGAAAILGDALNFALGQRIGPAVFRQEHGGWLNRKHLAAAQGFYGKHGGKTIILARFVPIVRSFAPFVAGVGKMGYARFALYNGIGAAMWVGLLVAAGRMFGGLVWVRAHFEFVVVAIVVISVLPVAVEYLRNRRKAGH
jgi:membrane-associated protein